MRNSTLLMQQGAHMVKLEGGGWTAPSCAFWSIAVCRCAPTWLHPQRCMRSAATGCRAESRPPPDPAGTGRGARRAGAELLVLELVPAAWRARFTPGDADPVHRHRRRQRLQRPGPGAARHAGLTAASRGDSCATFWTAAPASSRPCASTSAT